MNLRLSKEHGLNPCIAECFVCGKPKNEIILTGAAGEHMAKARGHSDGKMPMYVVFDIEPCDKCKASGISFIEMDKEGPDCKPTGRAWLIKEELIKEKVHPQELLEQILKCRACYITHETAVQIGLPTEQ